MEGNSSTNSSSDPDAQFAHGLDAIRSAYDGKTRQLLQERDRFRELALTSDAQVAKLESQVNLLAKKLADAEHMLLACQQENDALLRKQQTILTKYNKLKTLTVQLETFKKSIVHMVTYSPASSQALPAEELSVVLDDGEHDADALNHRASHGSSSSRPDQLSRSEHSEQDLFRALRAPAPPIFTQVADTRLTPQPTSPQAGSMHGPTSPLDAQHVYDKVREALTPDAFREFATIIGSFNSNKLSAEETIRQLTDLIKDQQLVLQMKRLVYKALAESTTHNLQRSGSFS